MSTTTDGAREKAGRTLARRLPVGVEVVGDHLIHARVWAPAAHDLEIVVQGRAVALARDANGYFSGETEGRAGDRYGFRVNGSERLYPDPASRYQPEGPHNLSEIVDPNAFQWTDRAWSGVSLAGQVLYELHTGTFTQQGTWRAAAAQLEELAKLGITVIELMPIAEFDGRFGWGYDGVDPYAPSHLYGHPDDLRAFVDRAHALGVGVILDVVYNHLGPAGNYLRVFSEAYFTDRYENEWGDAINFDGADAGPVREFFIANAGYWIDEFHLDGLRLDATQQIFDASPRNVMAAIGDRVREKARSRRTIIVAENEPQDTRLVRPAAQGGFGLDALWNDDLHHSAIVALTGRAEAYYSDTRGTPQEFVSAAKYGYLYQGQYYHWQRKPRGTPALDLPPSRFVVYLQNHDQVANSARGVRGHQLGSAAKWRAMTAYLLLAPGTPMLFQGQEFSVVQPVSVFRRPRRGAGRRGQNRPCRVPAAVSQHRALRGPPDSGRSRRRADVLALQTRFHRARDQRSRLRAAPRSAGAAADPCGVPQPARRRRRRRRDLGIGIRPPVFHGDHRRRAGVDREPRAGPEGAFDRRAAHRAAGRSRLGRGVVQ